MSLGVRSCIVAAGGQGWQTGEHAPLLLLQARPLLDSGLSPTIRVEPTASQFISILERIGE